MIQTLTICNYIRKVKVKDVRKANFYEWDGRTIHVTKKKDKIPIKFARNNENTRTWIDQRDGIVLPTELNNDVMLGVFTLSNKFIRCATADEKNGILNSSYKYLVTNVTNNKPLIVNIAVKDKPEYLIINGNYSIKNQHNPFNSKVMISAIKDNFRSIVEQEFHPVKQEHYPVRILFELHDTIKNFEDKENFTELGVKWDIDNRCSFYIKAFLDLLIEEKIIIDDNRLYITQPPAPVFVPVEDIRDSKLVFHLQTDDRPCIIENEIYQKVKKGEIK